MKKSNDIYIKDILDSIDKIELYGRNMDYLEFVENTLVVDAIVRNLEIIGEAANRFDNDFVDAHPEIPIKEAKSMRNFLIHDYGHVNVDIVWETIKKDLPNLKTILLRYNNPNKD